MQPDQPNALQYRLQHHHRMYIPNKLWRGFHVLLILLGWVAFAWLLYQTFSNPETEFWLIMIIIVGCLIAIPIATISWIFHNVKIFKRKGIRTGVMEVKEKYEADWEGNIIHADWSNAKSARKIVINIDATGKHYLIQN